MMTTDDNIERPMAEKTQQSLFVVERGYGNRCLSKDLIGQQTITQSSAAAPPAGSINNCNLQHIHFGSVNAKRKTIHKKQVNKSA
jgi:hypothetical protein